MSYPTTRRLSSYLVSLLVAGHMWASLALAQGVQQRSWKVGDVERQALVYIPARAKEAPAPLVFVFHGHGGSSQNAHRSFAIDQVWPEAISVYPQGLKTPGKLTDPEGKRTGWQSARGDQEDRDLKFFDAILESLKKECKIDERRIYSTGHSNGGGFTYLLWAERGDLFAAMGPSAATAQRNSGPLKPKPMFQITSENDPLVKYEWQKAMISKVRTLNATGEPQPWKNTDASGQSGKQDPDTNATAQKNCTLYSSPNGHDVVIYLHDGGHKFAGRQAVQAMVKFFQDHPKK